MLHLSARYRNRTTALWAAAVLILAAATAVQIAVAVIFLNRPSRDEVAPVELTPHAIVLPPSADDRSAPQASAAADRGRDALSKAARSRDAESGFFGPLAVARTGERVDERDTGSRDDASGASAASAPTSQDEASTRRVAMPPPPPPPPPPAPSPPPPPPPPPASRSVSSTGSVVVDHEDDDDGGDDDGGGDDD